MSTIISSGMAMTNCRSKLRSTFEKPIIAVVQLNASASDLPAADAIVCVPVAVPQDNPTVCANGLAKLLEDHSVEGQLQGALLFSKGTNPHEYAEQIALAATLDIGWFVSPDETVTEETLDKLHALIVDPAGDPGWLDGAESEREEGDREDVRRLFARREADLPEDRHLDEYFR